MFCSIDCFVDPRKSGSKNRKGPWTSHHLNLIISTFIRVMSSGLWHSQNHFPLLLPYHIDFCSFSMFLIKILHCTIQIPYIYISHSIFFSLNPCFLENSELRTNPVTPLFNNTSIVISYMLISSNPIFTITSLNRFPFESLYCHHSTEYSKFIIIRV